MDPESPGTILPIQKMSCAYGKGQIVRLVEREIRIWYWIVFDVEFILELHINKVVFILNKKFSS